MNLPIESTFDPSVQDLSAQEQIGQQAEKSTDRVRVLHLINGEHYSGAERVQDLLALCLPESGYEVGFACVKPDKFPEQRTAKDAPLYQLPMFTKFDVRAVWKLVALIRREGYQLLHCHTPRTVMIGRLVAPLAGVKMVYHVHSPTSKDSTRPLHNWLNNRTERFSLGGADQLIAVSNSLKKHMISEGFPEEMVTVVSNGVPALEALPKREAPSNNWTLGSVALYRPRKGMEVLIDALAMLREQGLELKLRAVGPFETPQYEQEIKDRVEQRGVGDLIEWTGFTSDVNAELRKMDLFVLPSLFGEGLPMVVLEAMAAGAPVVCTRVEGAPEAVRDDIDGVLAEPNDAESLATAIKRVVTGELDWTQLRNSAAERHRNHFSDHSMARGVAAVYDKVLGS